MRVIKGGKSLNDMADRSSPLDVLADGLLGERNLGDIAMPTPRAWLLGNTYCRGFHSSLLGLGGVGKTAVRYAQLMACASGRPITGEHVFERSRVLILCFEDGMEELERRLLAVMIYHHIEPEDMRDWLFYSCPTRRTGKLARIDQMGNVEAGDLVQAIESAVQYRQIDILAIDPFIKAHGVEENDNSQMDAVMEILAELAIRNDIATDASAHVRKGNDIAGNAEAGRGASAQKDAARLVYTLTTMAKEEAEALGVDEKDRKSLIRMDSAKVNIVKDPGAARWFELVDVPLGNATELYPRGDHVQTVRSFIPKGVFGQIGTPAINAILDEIEAGTPDGLRYSAGNRADERAVWRAVQRHVPDLTPPSCRKVIKRWLETGLLIHGPYDNPKAKGKKAWGLFVDNSKRPGTASE